MPFSTPAIVIIVICCVVLALLQAPWLIQLFGITLYLTGALVFIIMLHRFICFCKTGNWPYSQLFPNPLGFTAKPKNTKLINRPNHQPQIALHGTTKEAALDIYNTGLVLVDKPVVPGFFVSDDFEYAKQYAKQDGYVVVFKVDPAVKLVHKPDVEFSVYYISIPDAKKKPLQIYYDIRGLTPIGMLDYSRNIIRGRLN